MAKNSLTCIMLIIVFTIYFVHSISIVEASGNHEMGFGWKSISTSSCDHGSIGECQLENEFEMDSEINRRILATTKYVSYEALKKNTTPCSKKGASYYNCKDGAEANSYNRGCSKLSKCKS
ncbi:hypothetical protein MKW98_020315 [Papaver atlanticum]|uniref:Rapid ALkalinization Factor n=1 Tax=Papaver atlanticum TaxID=357466 RepID=A0AAD4TE36_9MAGN|nr:hypothetical protein MKW98_020315 [Papaver atlanticum]